MSLAPSSVPDVSHVGRPRQGGETTRNPRPHPVHTRGRREGTGVPRRVKHRSEHAVPERVGGMIDTARDRKRRATTARTLRSSDARHGRRPRRWCTRPPPRAPPAPRGGRRPRIARAVRGTGAGRAGRGAVPGPRGRRSWTDALGRERDDETRRRRPRGLRTGRRPRGAAPLIPACDACGAAGSPPRRRRRWRPSAACPARGDG